MADVAFEEYEAEYWDRLDGGQGYQDSLMWYDLAFITHHLLANDGSGIDRAGQLPHIDVGCAFGYMVRHMRERGHESFGLDYSSYALSNAPEDVKPFVRRFDLTHPNNSHYGTGRFSILTCFETLEHLPAESAPMAINHLWKLLAAGGRALITICTLATPDWQSDPTHVNVTNRDWWVPLFEARGFVEEHDLYAEVKKFHLFAAHGGVFVLRKP